ncbi:MAG: diaminopimelate decarboxylase [archaeon]|nr:diaminopimelate decarboxylase [archaeon]
MRDFESKDGIMQFGGVPVTDLANEFGTPVYVTDEQILRHNYREVYDSFSKFMDTEIYYACKANTNLAILKILNQEGSCVDTVSIGEVLTCLKAGFSPDKIMYTGVSVGIKELEAVVKTGCKINIDSEAELEKLAEILGPRTKGFPLSIRITPGVVSGYDAKVMTGGKGSKFGIPMNRVLPAYIRAQELGFSLKGIHAHTGSGGNSIDPFLDAVEVLINIANQLEEELGIKLEFLNFGGGLGVPYKPQEEEFNVEDLASAISEIILEESSIRKVCLEPGRYIVCDSTIMLTRCNDIKDAGPKKYVGTDAGFNTLIRPTLYGSYHHVVLANKFNKACTAKYDVVGPICESGDYIACDRALPDPQIGDIVAVYNAGAYGFSMSSVYNSRPRCKEVLVNNGNAELIRDSETMEDIWEHQIIPERLLK